MGYNYFNMGRLTYLEINKLVEVRNDEIREQERSSRPNTRRIN
jgi:hypothetical protein